MVVNVRSNTGGSRRGRRARSRRPAARRSPCSATSPIRRPREALAAAALKHFGRIDILVNNAALRREKPIDEMTLRRMARGAWTSSLDGAFHCVKACLPALRKQRRRHRQYRRHERAYRLEAPRACDDRQGRRWSASRAALAHDLAADKITANCVVPGAIDTARPADRRQARRII